MRKFQRGETIAIWAEVKDSGVYTDPGAIVITITNPEGTVKVPANESQAMTKDEDGIYVYNYDSAVDDVTGWWRVRVTTTDGDAPNVRTVITDGGFTLE